MNTIRHVIWDWNGTLFDDAWLCRTILNELLAARGKPIVDEVRYQEIFVFPVRDYYGAAGFDFSIEPFESPAHEFIERYESRRLDCSIRPEAQPALESIREAGISQSVLSAYEQETLQALIEHFGLNGYFECICGLDNPYAAGKIDLGKQMIARRGIEPDYTVIIGDTTHDFEVAQALGTHVILMPGGHHSRARLEACTSVVVDSLSEIKSVLFG